MSQIDSQIIYAAMTFVAALLGVRLAARVLSQGGISWGMATLFAIVVTALGYYF
ncbi:MAG: hypothetical protein O2824_01085 [Proteobacteria bacterium]|nr:hypothetical protein [Rhodobacterales bacterium LSUCC0374]MBF9040884.1 hypothetical protein [Rhodobacterales bacterium LSUCC0387]MDA0900745.1 hypothetical protein [Pseudomonadota bacterium]